MPSCTTSNDTANNSHVTFHEQNEDIPLLLQPSYARSKSLIHDELRNFRISLQWCALDHSSCLGKFISYTIFIFFTIVVPLISALSITIPPSQTTTEGEIGSPLSYNKLVQIPESGLALIAFFTLFGFFRKYGLRQLLFLDGLQDDLLFVRQGYSKELDRAFRYKAWILLPSFIVELAHKIILFSEVKVLSPGITSSIPLNAIMFVFVLASWIYRTGLFLLVCVLFRLTCELQILRFEGLHKMFERCESDAGVIYREHVRIKKQLSATSHRYRFFIIACLITITVCQLGALLLVLALESDNSFINYGDLVVCCAIQLSGLFLCLLGAARITHRAQGIVSIATRWHMILTSESARHEQGKGSSEVEDADDEATPPPDSDGDHCHSDSNSEIFISVSLLDPSSFQTRQALVAYLQHNNGGITLFGFALDRGMLHTIFAFEFSLVLWILSKVVVLS